VGLIHAVNVAVEPVRLAFKELWPEATLTNLLDDSLSPDLTAAGSLTNAITQRIASLGNYVVDSGADAVLFTCSAFGPAIQEFAAGAPVPVLRPNEAMFERAVCQGSIIGMLATFASSVPSMEQEFREAAAHAGSNAELQTIVVDRALAALQAGDAATHDLELATAARRLAHCDVIMLAHFSTSVAFEAVSQVVPCPVLTSPRSAVEVLRERTLAAPNPAVPMNEAATAERRR
jgi:hypothetical protein